MVIFHTYVNVYRSPIKSYSTTSFLRFSYGFPMVFLWFSYGFSYGFANFSMLVYRRLLVGITFCYVPNLQGPVNTKLLPGFMGKTWENHGKTMIYLGKPWENVTCSWVFMGFTQPRNDYYSFCWTWPVCHSFRVSFPMKNAGSFHKASRWLSLQKNLHPEGLW